MDDVIFLENSQIFKIQYLRNYAIKMHRVNAKKFKKFFPNDLFYKINNDSDFIAPFNAAQLQSIMRVNRVILDTTVFCIFIF